MRPAFPTFLLFLALASPGLAGPGEEALGLVPRPQKMELAAGPGFEVRQDSGLRLEPANAETRALASRLRETFGFKNGLPERAAGPIRVNLVKDRADLGDEGYALSVDAGGITLSAQTSA